MLHLFRVIVPVTRIEEGARFYQAALAMPGERVSSGRHYFDCGGTILACFSPRDDGDDFELSANPEYIYFAVDDLEEAFIRCQNAGCKQLDSAIKQQPWGERSFYLEDPFGSKLCFVDAATVFTGKSKVD